MTRKTNNTKGLGRSIQIAKKQHADRLRAQANKLAGQLGVGLATGGSVLEQTCLDELIATVELRKEAWAEDTGEAEFVQNGPSLVSCLDASAREAAEAAAVERRDFVSIPRRPKWNDSMSADELNALENEAFSDWRRDLAKAAQDEGLFLTPYERNLDFWRQLWRCVERSDLLVQIVDARDPDFYLCRDLSRYLGEVDSSKRLMVIVNKADFLSDELRASWHAHFQSRGIDAVFFSGLRELRRQQKEQSSQAPHSPAADELGAEEAAEHAAAHSSAAPVKKVSIWARAKEAAEESEGESDQDREVSSSKAPAGSLDPADVAVPGLDDSDEDLDEEGDDNGNDEEEQVLGPRAEDEFEGVADAGKLVEELLSRLPSGEGAGGAEVPAYRGTVGFVGYPNVGKSTVINAIVGKTLVGMSRTPGKTKHIQTLELPSVGITLCDCPGLVFPSVAATKAHLVINNTVHIDDLRECFSPITLIVQKVGWKAVLDRYDCAHAVQDARARSGDHVLDDTHAFLAALAVSRQHFLRAGVPDENWAARKVLKDYVSGALLHCERPLVPRPAVAASAQPDEAATSPTGEVADAAEADAASGSDGGDGEEDQEDFNDLQSFLQEARGAGGGRKERGMTKRRMRQMNKQIIKGKGPVLEAAGNVGVGLAVCHRQAPRGA